MNQNFKMLIGFFAAAIGLAALLYYGFSWSLFTAFQTVAIMLALVLAVVAYWRSASLAQNGEANTGAIMELEAEMLRRLNRLEATGKSGAQKPRTQTQAQTVLPVQTQPDNPDGDNVVQLRDNMQKNAQDSVQDSAADNAAQKGRTKKTNSTRAEFFHLCLQPIFSAPQQKIIGYSVFAAEKGDRLGKNGLSLEAQRIDPVGFDTKIIDELAKVVRYLKKQDSLQPLFYCISPELVANKRTIAKLLARLSADRTLAGKLVLGMRAADYSRLSRTANANFFSLLNAGIKLALFDLHEAPDLRLNRKTDRFSFVKCDARALTALDGETNLPQFHKINPIAKRLGAKLIATHIDEGHLIASLIDGDITLCQGDHLFEPKMLKLYKPDAVQDAAQ